jgi:hypothetical protein
MHPVVRTLRCIVPAALFTAAHAHAATIHVPGDYLTIYQALDAAVSGDIVEVAPGTYDQSDTRPVWAGDNVSSIGFLKDGVILRSSGGAGATTLRLDSSTARPVILFGGTGDFEVQGFTFTGSLADLIAIAIQAPDGESSSLLLKDCEIRDYGLGATLTHESAIDASNAAIHIQNCQISNIDSPAAIAAFLSGGSLVLEDSSFEACTGGALEIQGLLDPSSLLAVARCSFENNGGSFLSRGAVSAQFIGLVLIEESWFYRNFVGIMYGCDEGNLFNSVMSVRNCTFAETLSPSSLAICAFANALEITGNTFYGGSTGARALHYNGILPFSTLILERNVISFSTNAPAVEAQAQVQSGCNVFWQNTGGHTSGFALGPTDLVSDPMFCDAPALDFTVNAASPCLPPNNNGCGQIGAWGLGCGDVSVEPSSWGSIQALYR